MQRRSLLVLGACSPLAFFSLRHLSARKPKIISSSDERALSQRINDLASSIRTPDDARTLVNLVSENFAEVLPSALATARLRSQVAHAEYLAVTYAKKLIQESRVADVWNAYANRVQAPVEFQVSPEKSITCAMRF